MKQSNNKKSRDVTAFLYERLSRDDNLEGENYSIGNQKKLLAKVAKEKGYTNLVHFLDDGISGVTMDRPGFVEMIRQLEQGKAAAVFVKDLSRLGRNYIEVGRLTEEFFPDHDIRLVAVSDLLSGIVKCPVCGVGMYGNKSIKHKADGSKYKDFYYYGCKHRAMTRGHKCDFKKQINEELLDSAVAEVIVKLVSNPKFAAMMQEKISMKVDTSAIEQEIAAHEKQLRQSYSVKARLMDEIDSLDPDDKHYIKRKADLDDRLYKMYDKIEDTENQLVAARAKKMAIEAEKLTGDNIYKVLIYFDKLYSVMDDQEKRQLMESLLSEVQIYEERQPNGQWLKSIKFKLPIIAEDMSLSLDNDAHIETVVLLSKGEIDSNMYQRPELDYLICNDPMGYADLVLNGNPGTYLKSVTEYKPLDS